jgi:hypothetical protein
MKSQTLNMYKCLCCDQDFTTYSRMIMHLESGICDGGSSEADLVYSTAICYQSAKSFLLPAVRDEAACEGREGAAQFLEHHRWISGGTVKLFKCPSCPDNLFWKLSSISKYMEEESESRRPFCGARLGKGVVGKLQN